MRNIITVSCILQRTARTEFQKKAHELETALEKERDTNVSDETHLTILDPPYQEKLSEHLTGEKTRLKLAETQQNKQGKELSALNTDNASIKLLLEEEQARTLSLREQLKNLQVHYLNVVCVIKFISF